MSNDESSTTPNAYRRESGLVLTTLAQNPRTLDVIVYEQFDGQPGFGFTSSVVVSVRPLKPDTIPPQFLQHDRLILKVFDHTVSTASRKPFVQEPYNSTHQAILQKSIDDGSLEQLWARFYNPEPLNNSPELWGLAEELGLRPGITFGELVCVHALRQKDERLKIELQRLQILPTLELSFRLQLYFLWLRFQCIHEWTVSQLFQTSRYAADKFMPKIWTFGTVALDYTTANGAWLSITEHPCLVEEYIKGITVASIEANFRDDKRLDDPQMPTTNADLQHILEDINACIHSFLDRGFVYEDIHASQFIVNLDDAVQTTVRCVDYGALRPLSSLKVAAVEKDYTACLLIGQLYNIRHRMLNATPWVPDLFEHDISRLMPTACRRWRDGLVAFVSGRGLRFYSLRDPQLNLKVRILIEDIRQTLRTLSVDERTLAFTARLVGEIVEAVDRQSYSSADVALREIVFCVLCLFAISEDEKSQFQTLEHTIIEVLRDLEVRAKAFTNSPDLSAQDLSIEYMPASLEDDEYQIALVWTVGIQNASPVLPQPYWTRWSKHLSNPQVQLDIHNHLQRRANDVKSRIRLRSSSS